MNAIGAGAGEPMPETQLQLEEEYAAADAAVGAKAATDDSAMRETLTRTGSSARRMVASPAFVSLEDEMRLRRVQGLYDQFYRYFEAGNPESLLQFEIGLSDVKKNTQDLVPEQYIAGEGGGNCSILTLIALGIVEPTQKILEVCKSRGMGTPFGEIRSILREYFKPCMEKPFQSADAFAGIEAVRSLLQQYLDPGHSTIIHVDGKYTKSREPFVHTVVLSNAGVNKKRPQLFILDPQARDDDGKHPVILRFFDWVTMPEIDVENIWIMLGPTIPASILKTCPKTTEYPAMEVGGKRRRQTRKRRRNGRKTHRRKR
jgi:hypothetical protein